MDDQGGGIGAEPRSEATTARISLERSEEQSAAGEDIRAKRDYQRRRPESPSAARLPAPQARTSEAVVGRPRSALDERSEHTSAAGEDPRARRRARENPCLVERSEEQSAAGEDSPSEARIPAPQARVLERSECTSAAGEDIRARRRARENTCLVE